jgi:predicted tellurium resistance membrane protein TerC
VRGAAVVQGLMVAIFGLALFYFLVLGTVDGWEDWVIFSVIILAVIGGAIAVNHREYPAATQKRKFSRDSDSRW